MIQLNGRKVAIPTELDFPVGEIRDLKGFRVRRTHPNLWHYWVSGPAFAYLTLAGDVDGVARWSVVAANPEGAEITPVDVPAEEDPVDWLAGYARRVAAGDWFQ